MTPGTLSYAIAGVVYFALLIAALTVWQGRLRGAWFTQAFLCQVVWGAYLAKSGNSESLVVVELVRYFSWFLVLLQCFGRFDGDGEARSVGKYFWVVTGLLVGGYVFVGVLATFGYVDVATGTLRVWSGLALSVLGLVLVEQVARNTASQSEWRLRYVWLAVGGLFAYDLCLWSMHLVHATWAPELADARGAVNALVAGVLTVGLSRIGSWTATSFFSRRFVFFNATLLGTGLYVLAIGLASYVIRRYGASWSAVAQVVFLAGAAIVLMVAIFSDQFRAWLRVTLAKNLVPYQYDYRSEWLRLTRALSRTSELPPHERVAVVMARFVNSVSAGLWLYDEDAGAYLPSGGDLAAAGAASLEKGTAFLEYLSAKEWIYDLDDARSGKLRPGAAPAPDWLLADARAWLVVPLLREDTLVGLLVIGQPLAKGRLGWEQLDLLRVSGRQVAGYLAFETAARRLAQMSQFEALNRLSAFLMHDLRHLIAQQALVVENAAKHRNNPEFIDDAILTIDNSVKRMTRLMEQLRSGTLNESARRVDLAELCAELVQRCGSRQPAPRLQIVDRGVQVGIERDRLLHVLEHIVRNAQDATPATGSITIQLRRASHSAVLTISDTGAGMDEEFVRSRLFKPFDTTKGEQGMGIGAYEAREFVRRAGGTVTVHSVPDEGTRFEITLPLVADSPGAKTFDA